MAPPDPTSVSRASTVAQVSVSRDDVHGAAQDAQLTPEQEERLWEGLARRARERPRFGFISVAYYVGAMIVICAMGFFMTLGWELFGGWGIAAITGAYVTVFVLAARTLAREPGMRVPSGLLYTVAVCLTPLFIYGIEKGLGLWPRDDPSSYRDYHVHIKATWIAMELGTLAAGMVALRRVRFPFLTSPVAFTLWYMSMDLAPLFLGREFSWHEQALVSVVVGFLILLMAYAVDRRIKEDFAFWLYLFGMLAFWGGLSSLDSGSELNRALYALLNLGLMGMSILLRRRVFLVFGSIGVFGYVSYLSWRVFENSLIFPFALSFIGIVVIVMAVYYQRHQAAIEAHVLGRIPGGLLALLPPARD